MYLRVKLSIDNDLRNPTEDDCQWQVASFQRGHVNTRSREDFTGIGWRRKLAVGTAFLLHYQEHGSCRWSLFDGTYEDLSDADGIAWFERPSDMGAKDYAGRERDCRTFLACYTDWCNGDGLGWHVDVIDGDLDNDGEPVGTGIEVESDSCWGYFASDSAYFCAEVAATVRHFQAKWATEVGYTLPLIFEGDADYLRADVETALLAYDAVKETATCAT